MRQKGIGTNLNQREWESQRNRALSSCRFSERTRSSLISLVLMPQLGKSLPILSFTTKRQREPGPGLIEPLDPAIPEVSGLFRFLLPKPARAGFSVTHHQVIVIFLFSLLSRLTIHSFPLIPLLMVGAISLSQALSPEIGYKSTSCSKPKQQDEEGERSVHFPHVSKHLDACQQWNRTSSFWSGNFGALSMSKGPDSHALLGIVRLTRICAEHG